MTQTDPAPRTGQRTSDYDYDYPAELIALEPAEPRDSCRLMVLNRSTGAVAHHNFAELSTFFREGDTLVVNSTRVFRARLICRRKSGAPAEVFLLRPLGEDRFEAMVRPGSKVKAGRRLVVSDQLSVEVEEVTDRGTRIVRLISRLPVWTAIERFGHIPLPPYIERDDLPSDAERYQTIYAEERGSVAAPTAGLHFTQESLNRLTALGVAIHNIVLHVGAGTFKPVESEDPAKHNMHEEWYSISAESAAAINAARARGGRIFAVGTTVLRALESNMAQFSRITAHSGNTTLFVRPPYKFRAVDGLITNFHLPRSSLLMLVSAFAGFEQTRQAYLTAVKMKYRLFSYGDAMLIVPDAASAPIGRSSSGKRR